MINSAKEAIEIASNPPTDDERDDNLEWKYAIGYLAGMKSPEVKALVEALHEANTKHMSYCDLYVIAGSCTCTCELEKRRKAISQYCEAIKP
jgi:hypothetical protein